MPALSLVHAVRVLPESIGECPWRDFTATLVVTLNGGSTWHMPWSWFGPRDHQPDLDRIEQAVAALLQERMTLVN